MVDLERQLETRLLCIAPQPLLLFTLPDLFDDELMNLLADALENRRARVVTEWDRVRRRADTRASTFASSRKIM